MSDTNISYKFDNANQSFKAFDEVFKFYFKKLDTLAWTEELDLRKVIRDSLIQRFECSVETCWKLLGQYLKEHYGIYENGSPKVIFRKALKAKLLTEDEIELSIKMIDDRNLAAHTYKEETVEEIVRRIPDYHKLVKKIISIIKPNVA